LKKNVKREGRKKWLRNCRESLSASYRGKPDEKKARL
jgi:hypothetical protein